MINWQRFWIELVVCFLLLSWLPTWLQIILAFGLPLLIERGMAEYYQYELKKSLDIE